VLCALASCGKGATDSTPPLPLTTVTRIEVQLAADSVLVGDSLMASARGLNRDGAAITLSAIVWSTTDSSIGAVSGGGVLRGRNIGTVRVDALADGALGSRTVRVVPRPLRVRVIAPDTSQLVDEIQISAEVQSVAGLPLPEVAPRFAVADTSIATVATIGIGRARVTGRQVGGTDLLAIIGRDTTRRRLTLRLTPLRSLSLQIESRVVAVGDSVPFALTAIDTAGRTIPATGTILVLEPQGTMLVRNGHMIALGIGRVLVGARHGATIARDTLTAQGSSEFPLDIVDGDGQRPLPLKVLLSMERVAIKWRRVIREAPAGDFVQLQVGECRNAVPVSQFITGVRVLIKLDSLPPRIGGQGGPCVLRPNGLPLLGTISLNLFNYNLLSDQKLDDLLQHEVGHVLGLGTIWGRGSFARLVDGDSSAADPIFIGPNALSAFALLGRSTRFAGRRVPLQIGVRGHWRSDAFGGELMSPSLIAQAQPVSSVTVAALRDLGWVVEPEAYEEYALPDEVVSGSVASRKSSARQLASPSLDGDLLFPQLQITRSGRTVRLDPTGKPGLR
jgi:hypothetical protein